MMKKVAQARASSPPPLSPRRVSGTGGKTQDASLAVLAPASPDSFKSAPPSPVVTRKASPIRVKTGADAPQVQSSQKPSSDIPVTKHASKPSLDSAIGKPTPKSTPDAPSSKPSAPTALPNTVEKVDHRESEKLISKDAAAAADATSFDVQGDKDPVLPMTPKSPDPRSPVAGVAPLSNDAMLPTRNIPVGHDMEVVQELLGTMKQMLGTLGATFDTLGDQTIKVATFPAAIDAVHQIASVRIQLHDQHERQEQRMMEFKTHLQEEVRTRLYGRLKETANTIVQEVIQREIAERVRKELHEQIPQRMRDEVLQYKRQIMEVKISLHNSEARRHNALIRTNSLDESLRPLLRPPPPGEDAVPLDELELMTPSDDGRATPLRGLDTSALPPALTIDARLRSKSKSGIRGKHLLKEPATPSPLFPRDLSSLMNLSPHETKALIKDYGLARLRHVARTPVTQSGEPNDIFSPSYNTNAGTVRTEVVEEDEPREESLNRFLSYIGVNFRLESPTHGGNALGI